MGCYRVHLVVRRTARSPRAVRARRKRVDVVRSVTTADRPQSSAAAPASTLSPPAASGAPAVGAAGCAGVKLSTVALR